MKARKRVKRVLKNIASWLLLILISLTAPIWGTFTFLAEVWNGRGERVSDLLTTGKYLFGGFSGKISIVITKKDESLYTGKWSYPSSALKKALSKITVYDYWIEDDTLVIRIHNWYSEIKAFKKALAAIPATEASTASGLTVNTATAE